MKKVTSEELRNITDRLVQIDRAFAVDLPCSQRYITRAEATADIRKIINETWQLANALETEETELPEGITSARIKTLLETERNYHKLVLHIVDIYEKDNPKPTNYLPIVSYKGILDYITNLYQRAVGNDWFLKL